MNLWNSLPQGVVHIESLNMFNRYVFGLQGYKGSWGPGGAIELRTTIKSAMILMKGGAGLRGYLGYTYTLVLHSISPPPSEFKGSNYIPEK